MTFDLTGLPRNNESEETYTNTILVVIHNLLRQTAGMGEKILVYAMWSTKQTNFSDEEIKGTLRLNSNSNTEKIKMFYEYFAK